jgi:hypothetical protein
MRWPKGMTMAECSDHERALLDAYAATPADPTDHKQWIDWRCKIDMAAEAVFLARIDPALKDEYLRAVLAERQAREVTKELWDRLSAGHPGGNALGAIWQRFQDEAIASGKVTE